MAIVRLTPDAREQLAGLPKAIKARVLKILERLERWPEASGVKPLSGDLAGCYRARTGDYRVQFREERAPDETEWLLTVEKIGHRDGFYE